MKISDSRWFRRLTSPSVSLAKTKVPVEATGVGKSVGDGLHWLSIIQLGRLFKSRLISSSTAQEALILALSNGISVSLWSLVRIICLVK